ncbi:MAG: hypothetical protein MI924_34775 [Chloroflexales bacterium]|nr:hypothetical protein [Chloroflexales bacterium]
METYILTPAELAVLTKYLSGDALVLGEAAYADLGVTPEQLSLAEDKLAERGLLVRAPGEQETGMAGYIATVLATSFAPDIVCVVRTQRRNTAEPVMYYSFTPECIARNYMDATGQHVFCEFATVDNALHEILAVSGVTSKQTHNTSDAAQPLDVLLTDSETLTLLMAVIDPAMPQPQVHTLSWLVARNSVWLVTAEAQPSTASACPINRLELWQAIAKTLVPDHS